MRITNDVSIGPALVFERLWKELGIGDVIKEVGSGREYQFDLERAIFLTVLHRLFSPGSDRAAEKWKQDFAIRGTEDIELHQLYRAMGWIGEPIEGWLSKKAPPTVQQFTKDRSCLSNA